MAPLSTAFADAVRDHALAPFASVVSDTARFDVVTTSAPDWRLRDRARLVGPYLRVVCPVHFTMSCDGAEVVVAEVFSVECPLSPAEGDPPALAAALGAGIADALGDAVGRASGGRLAYAGGRLLWPGSEPVTGG